MNKKRKLILKVFQYERSELGVQPRNITINLLHPPIKSPLGI
ncbi:hypothetical protein [Paulownia witches'-broom phytoplasma]